MRIWQTGRRVGRGEQIQSTRGGVDQHGNFRSQWTERERFIVEACETERDEECEDVGFGLDDGDSLE